MALIRGTDSGLTKQEKPVYKDIDDTDTVTGKEVGDFIQTFPTNSSASCTKDLPNHGSCTFATNDDHVRVEWEYANSQYPVKTVDSSKLDPNRVDSVVFGAGIVKNPDGTLDVHIGHNEGGWKRVSKNYGEEVYVSAMSAVSGRSRPIKVTVKSSGPALQSDKDITTAGSFVRFGAQERRTESSNGDKNSTGGTQIETFFQKHVVSLVCHLGSPMPEYSSADNIGTG